MLRIAVLCSSGIDVHPSADFAAGGASPRCRRTAATTYRRHRRRAQLRRIDPRAHDRVERAAPRVADVDRPAHVRTRGERRSIKAVNPRCTTPTAHAAANPRSPALIAGTPNNAPRNTCRPAPAAARTRTTPFGGPGSLPSQRSVVSLNKGADGEHAAGSRSPRRGSSARSRASSGRAARTRCR